MLENCHHVLPSINSARFDRFLKKRALYAACIVLAAFLPPLAAVEDTPGVSGSKVRIAGVMALEGDSQDLGRAMRMGIEAALSGEKVQGREFEFVAVNDFYDPAHTAQKTQELVDQGVFAMLGSVGTPTAAAALPILAEHKIPAIGFLTGANLLRPGVGDIVNYRASYVQEVSSIVGRALEAGVAPTEVCSYVQNDAYGMAGIEGIRQALAALPKVESILSLLDQIIEAGGPEPTRNDIGPVGVYTRNTLTSRDGYNSLKNWETKSNTRCRLVVTVGSYEAIGRFVAYSRYRGDDWVISAVSFTGTDSLKKLLDEYGITVGVLVTQVVPSFDSDLPIVKQARNALGDKLNDIALEGYIVGKMLLHGMRRVEGELTREAFLNALIGTRFELGGLDLDFKSDNQGSDFVDVIELKNGVFAPVTNQDWARIFSG